MNKTEQAYADLLERNKLYVGDFVWWAFEAMKFKLAPNTFYTPDFVVMLDDGTIELHEVKGHWEDDARVKIKVAASMFPFTFKAFRALPKKQGGGFREEIIGE
jgi:hypothetical protein